MESLALYKNRMGLSAVPFSMMNNLCFLNMRTKKFIYTVSLSYRILKVRINLKKQKRSYSSQSQGSWKNRIKMARNLSQETKSKASTSTQALKGVTRPKPSTTQIKNQS